MIVGAVDVDAVDVEREMRALCARGRGDGEHERERPGGEEGADSNGSPPARSEKEDAGVWKEVKPVCVELIVPLGAGLNLELRERDLDVRLWWRACRSIEGVRGGATMVGSAGAALVFASASASSLTPSSAAAAAA